MPKNALSAAMPLRQRHTKRLATGSRSSAAVAALHITTTLVTAMTLHSPAGANL
jgi:hypothetical protein